MEQGLFQKDIYGWESWTKVFQDKEAFAAMINSVLPGLDIENCTPGTHAVFKVGNYIVKIFAPKESGLDTDSDYKTELYGMKWAQKLGIPVPKLISSGFIEDRYLFRYLVMEYIDGEVLGDVFAHLTDEEKYSIGRKLRNLTDKLNRQVEPFNDIDVVHRAFTNDSWDVFSSSFNDERIEFLSYYKCEALVFVHGDINLGNVLVGKNGELYLIDFADGLLAPVVYEHACIAVELFQLDPVCLRGFFGEFEIEELVDKCIEGLLLHDFGADILCRLFSDVNEITGLTELKERLLQRLN